MVQIKSCVITAIYDRYDTLKPILPQTECDVDWVCVTDDKDLKSDEWRIIYDPHPSIHPNRAAKNPKMFPWQYTNSRSSIWLDASFQVISDKFVSQAISYADPIAQFMHPWRDCIYEEASESIRLRKYKDEPVEEQIKRYKDDWHPEHWGLWATGVIARHHTVEIKSMSKIWNQEINRYSFQDQISQPIALRVTDLRPTNFPDWHMQNNWVRYEGSERH